MAVGTAGGHTGTILMAIGGDLGPMLTQDGGGHIRMPIHMPIPTPLIHLRRRLPSLRCMANPSNSNLTTGITARTHKATTRTSKAVRVVGCRWYQM